MIKKLYNHSLYFHLYIYVCKFYMKYFLSNKYELFEMIYLSYIKNIYKYNNNVLLNELIIS